MPSGWRNHTRLFVLLVIVVAAVSACSHKVVGIGVPADKEVLYIGSTKDQVIALFVPATGERLGEYRFRNYRYTGYELSPDGRELYVYGAREQDILVYDTLTGKEVHRFATNSGTQNMILCDDSFILLQGQERLQFIDVHGVELGEAVTLPFTIKDFQLSSDRASLYLIHAKTDHISEWSIAQRQVVRQWDTISNPTIVWDNIAENELWVGGHGSISHIQMGIARYSLTDGNYLGEIPSGEMPVRFYPDSTTGALFAVSHGSNHLMKVDGTGHVLAETTTGVNPYAIDSDGQSLLYVASYDSQLIKAYELATLKETLEFPVDFSPLWLKYRGKVESR